MKYKIKSCIDTFSYSFKKTDADTGEIRKVSFSVKEKRIVSFDPALAEKQKSEIMKKIRKASSYVTYKNITREELDDSAKYIFVKKADKDEKKIKPDISLNKDKTDEDMAFAGYNMIVTSAIEMEPEDIYHTYHGHWEIEESFRITKSFLDARPAYVRKRETIYGHFLICYLTLLLLREFWR